ncbi:S9 family peptidase [Flavisphingomonas formosensis]|uniref:S9 family peptidase n=1 Tax=Flavisphingomonas formosensis TaxID=861534 RepID=UPI0018DF6E78|nr:S9 family peptidase [Sphingomonas formosensis]
MRSAFLGFAATLLATPALAASAPMSVDDILRYEDIADPAFSPDGASIVYAVTSADAKKKASVQHIWRARWAGGPAQRIDRAGDASAWQPHYSADGRWIGYLSDQKSKASPDDDNAAKAAKADDDDGDTQLWIMPAAGGPGRQVSRVPGGISDYSLSPDGRQAVVVAETGGIAGDESDPPPPVVIDRFYFKEDGRDYIDARTQQLFLVDLKTGKARQITSGARDYWMPEWSPDGKWIAAVGKGNDAADRTFDYDVYLIPASGGAPRRISDFPGADNDPGWESRLAWSPDSTRLAWVEGGEDKWIYYSPYQLAWADVATGAITRPARIDRSFTHPRWSADGKSIFALIENSRDTLLARVDAKDGAISYLTRGSRFALDFAVGLGDRIAVGDGDVNTPLALRTVESVPRVLSAQYGWVKDRRLAETRDLSFESDGQRIDAQLVLPLGYQPGKRYPLIVRLHGGPVYQFSHEFMADWQIYAANGYAVLGINPRGSSGRGFDFARAIYADWGGPDVRDIKAGIDHVIALGIADPDRIGTGGWSYGGILTDYMIASEPRLKAAISGAGLGNVFGTWGADMYAREYLHELGTPWGNVDTYKKLSYPFFHADRIKVPTLFECAGRDFNVPCIGAEQMYLALKTNDVPSRLVVYPGENHGLTVPRYIRDRMQRNLDWYDLWLKR